MCVAAAALPLLRTQGTNVWNSFFVGFTMFKNMPRQTFGKVQSSCSQCEGKGIRSRLGLCLQCTVV